MTIRPIDLQVNIGKEEEVARLRQQARINEEGQAHYAGLHRVEKDEKTQRPAEMKETSGKKVRDDEQAATRGGAEQEEKNKEKQDESSHEQPEDSRKPSEPGKGSLIDINI